MIQASNNKHANVMSIYKEVNKITAQMYEYGWECN